MRNALLIWTGVCLGLWAQRGSLLQNVPPAERARKNPISADTRAQKAGAKLYARECAACHGAQREGTTKAPPLKTSVISATPPGALFWVLRNGSLRHGMPSFAHLPEIQRWQIITYVLANADSAANR